MLQCARIGLAHHGVKGGADLMQCACGAKAGWRVDKDEGAVFSAPWYKRDRAGVTTKASEGGRYCEDCAKAEWKARAERYEWNLK